MVRIDAEQLERDDRLGQAIEDYLSMAESGHAPDADEYASRFPDLTDELREALDGLALVKGLVGQPHCEALENGQRVAGYRIVRELGRGGMGVVYEAVHVDLDRPVALKVLGHNAAPDSNSRRRFLNEAKTAASLHHTHIVPVFDVGQVGGLCYYAMQRIEGTGLDRVVKTLRRSRSTGAGSQPSRPMMSRQGPSATKPDAARDDASAASLLSETGPWMSGSSNGARRGSRIEDTVRFEPPRGSAYYRWVAQVGRQAADALGSAHKRGIIHRDVKPSNLLVDIRGSTWVADFGLARRIEDPALTHSGSPLGTPRYMSPEQASGGTIDARTDQYSLGATLYELVTLRPPFEGSTTAELIQQITNREPLPPRRVDPRVPRDLETIILKAMSKRGGDRYPSAEDMADDLERFLALEPVRARRIGPIGRFVRFAQRNPFPTVVSTLAASVVLAVTTWAHVNVVQQRDVALAAGAQTRLALEDTRKAIQKSEAARGQQLWREASLIRLSRMPDSRKQGLEALRKSAALDPTRAMQVKLREEALEFLALRDVEELPPIETGRTWGLAFTRDGERLASMSDDGFELSIYDPKGGGPVRRVPLRTGAMDSQPPIEPDRWWRETERKGRGVATVGSALAVIWPNGAGVRLIVPETGALYADLAMPDRQITSLVGFPGGRRLITVERVEERGGPPGHQYRALLWDLERPDEPLATLVEPEARSPLDRPGRGFPPFLAVSPDGRTIATASAVIGPLDSGATISLWDAETGTSQGRIEDIRGGITALALGPDGLLAAAVTDGTIRLWEGRNHTPLPGLYHRQMLVNLLRFSPDGTLLAVAGTGSGVELWDPATNEQVAALRTRNRATDLGFSSDGQTLAAACGESTELWAILDPVGRSRLPNTEAAATAINFDNAGRLAVGIWADAPRIWTPGDCPTKARTIQGVRASLVTLDADGRLLAADSDGLHVVDLSAAEAELGTVLAFRERDGIDRGPPRGPGPGGILPRGPWPMALVGSWGTLGTAPILDSALELARGSSNRPKPWYRSFPIGRSANHQIVAVAVPRRGDVYLWRSNNPGELERVQFPVSRRRDQDRQAGAPPGGGGPGGGGPGGGPPGPTWTNILISPRGDRLYLQSAEMGLQAWRLETRGGSLHAKPLDWSGQIQSVMAMDLSPDGRLLAVVRERGGLQLVDAIDGSFLKAIPATDHDADDHITSVAFAPDSKQIAVGFQRGRIALYSLAKASEPVLLTHLPGHLGTVKLLTFDPSGRMLASAGDDKSVQTWNLDAVLAELATLGLNW